MKTFSELLKEYSEKSQNPKYAGYTPLQCAALDGDYEDVQGLLFYYDEQKTTRAELTRVSEGPTKENILHIAMKHPEVFSLICWAIEEHDRTLFARLICQVDADEDTVFHQIAEYGRLPALKCLMTYVATYVDAAQLQIAVLLENKFQEKAWEIAEHGPESNTIQYLIKKGTITAVNLDEALLNRDAIQEIFNGEQFTNGLSASM